MDVASQRKIENKPQYCRDGADAKVPNPIDHSEKMVCSAGRSVLNLDISSFYTFCEQEVTHLVHPQSCGHGPWEDATSLLTMAN
ncbi:unnamed protein product [Ilex paraguariensis]|uniref:DNA-directed DNA polymerase n=1 Tax=Ilex paraguariensis TaxID=185542 RepID=A0ABC8SKN3_9AQUA